MTDEELQQLRDSGKVIKVIVPLMPETEAIIYLRRELEWAYREIHRLRELRRMEQRFSSEDAAPRSENPVDF